MKNIMLIMLLWHNVIIGQSFPIIEEFNPGTSWIFTNGAGIQNYGPPENYATTNIGSTPYPNNSNITITSPTYNFTTSCSSNLTVSFPISGIIENGFDFLRFQYFNAGSWVTQANFTGNQNSTPSYSIPNTATQFRFLLVTDCSVNGYRPGNPSCSIIGYPTTCLPNPGNCPGAVTVYYYDITRFTINCTTPLPVELTSFDCSSEEKYINLQWNTSTEINNDRFEIMRSYNAINYVKIGTVSGNGTTTIPHNYQFKDYFPLIGENYYQLVQIDYNGVEKRSNVIECSFSNNIPYITVYYDITGREIDINYATKGMYIRELINGNNVIRQIYYKNE